MSLDAAIQAVVVEAFHDALAPYLRRLADPEPLVYNVAEAAHVLATSTKTVRRLVDEGVLPVVPHMGHRVVIPRSAVMRLVDGAVEAPGSEAEPVTPATSRPTGGGALHVA
jgi:excisionase family DNA binding protein